MHKKTLPTLKSNHVFSKSPFDNAFGKQFEHKKHFKKKNQAFGKVYRTFLKS